MRLRSTYGWIAIGILIGAMGSVFAMPLGPARAAVGSYAYSASGSFGSAGVGNGQFQAGDEGLGVAIDQTSGDFYVTDGPASRIEKFDPSGQFLSAWGYGVSDGNSVSQVCNAPATCQGGVSGPGPGQFENPTKIAVDNSDGSNEGDVYVLDAGRSDILKFNSSGTYLGKLDGSGTPVGLFSEIVWPDTGSMFGGISVDGLGYLWLATGYQVLRYSNTASNSYVGDSEWTPPPLNGLGEPGNIKDIAANGNGSRLLVEGSYALPTSASPAAYLVDSDGGSRSDPLDCVDGSGGSPVFDPGTGHYFVANGTSVCEFDESGSSIRGPIGTNQIGAAAGIAVNGTSGDLYVEDVGQTKVLRFRPVIVPDATTDDPTAIGHTDAVLNGHVAPDVRGGGNVSNCRFEYGTTSSYGSSVPCNQPLPYSASTPVSAHVSGLIHDVTYHYRVVATNGTGTNRGQDRTVTPTAVFGVATDPPTNVTPLSATLNGTLDPNGSDTHYYFQWGINVFYGHTTAAAPGLDAGSAVGATPVSADIAGLANYTSYHYRLVATNSLGTTVSKDRVFTSAAPLTPVIGTPGDSQVSQSSAKITASVSPGYGNTLYLVEYGTDGSYGRVSPTNQIIAADNMLYSVTVDLTGLTPGTAYHFRIVAINFGGTAHSPDGTFITQDVPGVSGTASSAVTQTTATLSARINPNRSQTDYRFEYGLTPLYGKTTATAPVGADGDDHNVGTSLDGLVPGTTYHYRVVARNEVGTTVGQDQSFTTSAAATVNPPHPACRKGQVKRHGKCVKRPHRKHRARGSHHKRYARG